MIKLTFYNHYGNGDLFESREFCLDWMKLLGVTEAEYAHRPFAALKAGAGDDTFFSDLPQVLPEMDMRKAVTVRSDPDGLWVNTWIGRDGQYVINPGVGCVVEELYRMHNDMLRASKLPPLPRSVAEYIPDIDYARVNLGQIKEFLDEHRGDELVLLCNGPTGSMHASNFDFGPLANLIPPKLGRILIFTQQCPQMPRSTRSDIYWTDEIFSGIALTGLKADQDKLRARAVSMTKELHDVIHLNALAYLARHCSVMVGRCSGPHVFCGTKQNWMDSTKTLVCFTNHPNGACFVRDPEKLGLKMKVAREAPQTPEAGAEILNSILR
jgi:hypothetical protein